MTVSIIIAGYAALVATGNVLWQVWSARRADKVRIRVEVTQAIFAPTPGDDGAWAVQVTAYNDGAQSVTIHSCGLEMQDGSRGTFQLIRPSRGDSIPGTVQPKHHVEGFIWMEEAEAKGFDFRRPVVGYVRVSDGSMVKGKARTLRTG